jgi:hypothetical protein
MNRRHFLSIIAAGLAAPAIVKAENIMRIWTPPEQKIVNPFEGMWQDATGTIPVTAVGQPVGRWDQEFMLLVAPHYARPTAVFVEGRGCGTQFTGSQFMRSAGRVSI